MEIVVDSHEQYPYRFASQQATLAKRALPCGDYGLTRGGRLIASVERKSLADLVASVTSGSLRYALAELAALPRAAVVVEDRYSAVFKLDRPREVRAWAGLHGIAVPIAASSAARYGTPGEPPTARTLSSPARRHPGGRR